MRYAKIYDLLKRAGHGAARAAEIILDAQRGDAWAKLWIFRLFAQRRPTQEIR